MSDTEEARLAVEAAKATGLPVIASFAFDSGRNKDRTMMGTTPESVAAAMVEAGADGVGANCGVGVEFAVPICRRLHAACALPVWIKPNAGLPVVEGAAIGYATSAEYFASHYGALCDAGASFVGGCCGSTPEFVRALVAARCRSSVTSLARRFRPQSARSMAAAMASRTASGKAGMAPDCEAIQPPQRFPASFSVGRPAPRRR